MYRSTLLRNATAWLHSYPHERVDRLKLGGIHRAQPFSHEFEKGRYHEYMLADWALLLEEQQVERYEYLRDRRVLLPDVILRSRGEPEGGSGGDGSNEAADGGVDVDGGYDGGDGNGDGGGGGGDGGGGGGTGAGGSGTGGGDGGGDGGG
ncbi:MAG: hypothetical protein LQ346_003857, partial [Caloplaca aetnensis]